MSDYQLIIYANPESDVGHFSVAVTGPGINVPVSGKYMKDTSVKAAGKSVLGVPGEIRDDSDSVKNPNVINRTFPLSRTQAEKAADHIREARKNPKVYKLFGHNCVSFAQDTMDAAGVGVRVDEAFTEEELDKMGVNTQYGAGDEAQRRGLIIELEKDHNADPNNETRGFGPHAEGDAPKDDNPAGDPDEISEAPAGTGLDVEAARNAAEDKAVADVGSVAGVPESTRAEAMAIVADTKDAKGNDEGNDDFEDLMLKSVDDLTGGEARSLGQWAWKLPAHDPRRLEIEDRRRAFYELNYGDQPVALDATGRMIEPAPRRAIPEKPKELATPNGELVQDALSRIGDKLTKPVRDDGAANVVKALQTGLTQLGEKLKVDGVSGPKTRGALKRTVARHGAGKAEEAFAVGRFKRFAESERNSGGSASGLKQAIEKDVQPLFGQTKPTVAAEALQESINVENARAASERNQPKSEPLKVDGDIGPKTTDAFRSALAQNGPEKLAKSYTSMLGFAD